MIVDFINNVEPNFSYGTSDGMARAMVESAENMALINDYIVESTYEVYTEADGDRNIFGKIKDKIHKYFVLFVNLVRKAIEKIKGYYMTIKRKLTQAMAKGVKNLADISLMVASNKVYYKNNHKGTTTDIGNTTFNTYGFDKKKYDELVNTVNRSSGMISLTIFHDNPFDGLDDDITDVRDDFDKRFVKPKSDIGSVLLTKVEHEVTLGSAHNVEQEIKTIFKNVDDIMNEFYGYIMTSYDNALFLLEVAEGDAKKKFTNDPKELSFALKRFSKIIHTNNYIKYKSGQLVASACVKMYKKSYAEARRLIKNLPTINIR